LRRPLRRLHDVHGPLRGEISLVRPELARRFRAARRAARRGCSAAGPRSPVSEHAFDFMSGTLAFAHEINSQIALNLGVEPRSPMSDRRVIEFAVRMPLEAKLCAGWYKGLLRRAMAGILPSEVAWRQDVDGHPGWTFFSALCKEACDGGRLWNGPFAEGRLGSWVHVEAFRRAQRRYATRSEYESGLRVLSLGVLARWLEARFDGRAWPAG
jgi:asparagine synthetase B (glutamine-hydrolysing)